MGTFSAAARSIRCRTACINSDGPKYTLSGGSSTACVVGVSLASAGEAIYVQGHHPKFMSLPDMLHMERQTLES
jgi:hypothetical protein